MFGGSSNCRIMYIYIYIKVLDSGKKTNTKQHFLKTRWNSSWRRDAEAYPPCPPVHSSKEEEGEEKKVSIRFFFFFPLLPIISRPLRHSLSLDYLHNTDLCSLGNYSEQREQRAHRTFSFFSFLFLVSIYFPKFSIKSSDKENNT